nr:cellulase N-terminal Ig-like domain-containing protein [uncultured Caproiciproducens sp.]
MLTSKALAGRKFISLLLVLCMLVSLVPTGAFALENKGFTDSNVKVSNAKDSGVYDSGFMMTFKGSGSTTYLDTAGLSVFLCNTAFDRTFGDQKCSSMEMILNGQRVATDGDIRLSATPEQWDPVPNMKDHSADKTNGWLIANESYTDYNMTYNLKVTPEPGGFKVSVNLDNPLPNSLAGRAGFNLEFLPSIYKGKTYITDDDTKDSGMTTGVFPVAPSSQMEETTIPAGDPITRNTWQEEWDAERGNYQATPLATAKSDITLAPEDNTSRVKVVSENGLALYDGRNKAQNGWFVLRSLIPSGKTTEAVVWHVRPNVIQDFTQEPVVTYSQVGYVPNSSKVAVIQLDPKYTAPQVAAVDRLNADGTYTKVFEGAIAEPIPYTRYNYSKFDFSTVTTPGTYAIEYAGKRTDLFPITENAYSNTWQQSLDTFIAEQMDHMEVRDGYRTWHGAAHLDDARQAPANISWFDGWSMGSDLNSPYKAGEHINGLNVGGWFDAGDFDIQTGSHISIIQDLAVAYKGFNLSYDNLTVDEDAHLTQMHKPDGVPDAVQQVKHGALQLLAQINSVGHTFSVLEVPTLRQYTHLGDGSTETDGLIYSANLGTNDKQNGYSGLPDDRWAFTSSSLDSTAYVSLAAAAWALKGWDNDMYQKCLSAAVKIWNTQSHTSLTSTSDYSAAVFLMLATYDPKNPDACATYKNRIKDLTPRLNLSNVSSLGWISTFIMPYMDDSFKSKLQSAVKDYISTFDRQMAATPYGVPTSTGMWGGSGSVCNMGEYMYFLHKAFPNVVSGEYTLRAANYILGTHPCSSLSYVCGVGKNSKVQAYSNNRADGGYIPGGVIPGYVVISPDFPECIDDFGMLWFEDETCTSVVSNWVVAALGASAVAAEQNNKQTYVVNFKVTDGTDAATGAKVTVDGSTYQTNSAGEAVFNLASDSYDYTVTKEDCNIVSGTFDVSDKDTTVPVTLTYNLSPTSVKINGTDLKNFNASVHDYYLAANLNPVVTAQSYEGVSVSVTQATSLPGTAVITLQRGGKTEVYTIYFREPPELESILVDGTPIAGFTSGNNEYFVQLPKRYSEFPTVTAKADAKYSLDITQATAATMKATVTVKDDHNIESSYSVSFGTITSIDFSKIKSVDQLKENGWSIYNPNLDNIKFVNSGITVISEAGDWYSTTNTAKNIVTCDDASGDWQADLEVAVNKPFYDNFQQCAIEAYKDYDNYTKLDIEYNSYSGGIRCQLGSEASSSFTAASNAGFTLKQGADGSYPLFYKFVKKGNTYSGYVSTDGINFTSCGTATNSMTNLKLGLAATNNTSTQPVEATFKKLTITHPTSSDKETLQNLYDTCKAITQGNYTDSSWAAFTTALKKAKAVLDSSSATPYEISESVAALTDAENGLTEKANPTTDKSALQKLYDTCKVITQGNYTDASWAAFTTALAKAKLVLDNSSATLDDVNKASTALTDAKNGLTGKSSNNNSNHHSSTGGNSTISTEPSQPSQTATFTSDTTVDVHVKESYIVKLTSKNGQIPTVVLGTPGVFEVQLVSVNGSDYYVKLIPVGKPGEQTGVYVNGVKIFVANVETPVSSIKCDTTKPFSLKSHSSYIFKLTSDTKPTFVAGNGSVFKVEFIKAVGKDYFFKVTAIGKVGATSGFYINSEKAPITVATIA